MAASTQYLVTFLYLGLCCSLAMKCPSKTEIAPCTCDEDNDHIIVLCTFLKTAEQLEQVMKPLKGGSVSELWIIDSNITNVPNDVLAETNTEHLFLSRSALYPKYPDKPILLGLEDSLMSLSVSRCYTSKEQPMPALAFDHLTAFTQLTIARNYLPVVYDEIFKGGPSGLEHVDFIDNNIEEVGDRAFVNLPSLKSLTLNLNRKFANLKRTMFPKAARKLEYLSFSRNGIESLPDDLFSNMPTLREIHFYDNKLTTISESVFSPVYEQLSNLDLNANPLVCDKNIKWMYEDKSPVRHKVIGRCVAPENLKNRYLEFIEKDELL